MKFVIVLCILSVLLLQQIQASPVKVVEHQERALARQQASAVNEVAPAAQAADEDDDDDDEDDDDEPDLGDLIEDDDVLLFSGLSDDDEEDDDDDEDDDDEEDDTPQGQAAPASGADDDDEEDDDDDDYLDRLFDDILSDGDDDEDDDDEETAASAPNPLAATPAAPIEDIAPVGQASGISDGVDLPESGNSNEPLASGNAVDNEVIPAGSSNNEGALTGDDDETDDDDEDDDDDDIIGDDVIEARREARALKNNIIDMSADAFQERNNHFVDAIFARINRIVSESYDPFVVKLNARSTVKHEIKSSNTPTHTTATKSQQQQSNKVKTAKPQTTNTSIKKLKNTKSEPRSNTNNDNISSNNSEESMSKDTKIQNEPKQQNKLQQQLEQLQGQQKKLKVTEQIENDVVTSEQQKQQEHTEIHTDEISPETRTALDNDVVKSGNQKKSTAKAHKQNVKKLHNTSSASTTNNHSSNNKQKLKSTANNNKNANSAHHGTASGKDAIEFLKAEGSLSGLSSLKRVGNVKLVTDPEGRNSTIKAKFTLGPLILRVEKSFKRAGVENVKSATARTNEMIGRIKFSVVNDRATLMSIKVQQPKQVEVESKDNHDRTREFVWRRTPKIAKLVNEKLKLAAETLFAPQGVEVVRL